MEKSATFQTDSLQFLGVTSQPSQCKTINFVEVLDLDIGTGNDTILPAVVQLWHVTVGGMLSKLCGVAPG